MGKNGRNYKGKWYLYQTVARHDPNYIRCFQFLANIIVGDDGAYLLKGEANIENVRWHALVGEPHHRLDSRPKLAACVGYCGNGKFFRPFFIGSDLNWNIYLPPIKVEIIL